MDIYGHISHIIIYVIFVLYYLYIFIMFLYEKFFIGGSKKLQLKEQIFKVGCKITSMPDGVVVSTYPRLLEYYVMHRQ